MEANITKKGELDVKTLVKKYPVTCYYVMTFGWTWTIVLILYLTGQTENLNQPSLFFILGGILCNVSPSLSAFFIYTITEGKTGVDKLKHAFKTKSSLKGYLIAFLVVPLITILTTLISHLTLRSYQWSLFIPTILMGLIWPIFSSTGEEFGWRGFILPRFLSKYSPLKAALLLGFIWEIWHLPMHWLAYKDFGIYMIPAFVVIGFVNLILQTIIMTIIYIRNHRSLKLMVIYHYTITASSIIISGFLTTTSNPKWIVYEGIVSVSLFGIIALMMYFLNAKAISSNMKESQMTLNH